MIVVLVTIVNAITFANEKIVDFFMVSKYAPAARVAFTMAVVGLAPKFFSLFY